MTAEDDWADKHWRMLRQEYARADGITDTEALLGGLYATVPGPRLTAINRHSLQAIGAVLKIETPITLSLDYDPHGNKTERLLDLCVKAGATEYVSGPAAKEYLDVDLFTQAGIEVSWFKYGPYGEYPQVHPPFELHVSILDLLLCAGRRAPAAFRSGEGLAA